MKKRIILLSAVLALTLSGIAYAEPAPEETSSESMTESVENTEQPSEGEILSPVETGPEGMGEESETPEETEPAETDDYCHIKVVTQFSEEVDPDEFTGFKMIFTPVGLEYYYDTGRIPDELKLENNSVMSDESYEDYEIAISHINDFQAELDISGLRAVRVQCTESNILKQDTHFYIPYGDDIITVDMADIDPSGFYVGECYFIRNEPGTEKTIYVAVSENPNPKKPDLNNAEITDEIKQITDMAMNGDPDEIPIVHTYNEMKYTNEEKLQRALPVIIGLIAVAGLGIAGYLYVRKIRNNDED